jgi:hypothetical protein
MISAINGRDDRAYPWDDLVFTLEDLEPDDGVGASPIQCGV